MNYSDKFGATSFQEVSSPFATGGFDIAIPGNTATTPALSGFIKINDAELLFSGSYKREGSDLVISNDARKLVVPDYFKGEVRPTLTSRDGAMLSGKIVDALTGHVTYAQASGAPEPPKEIGSVAKLTGSATAIRNGVAVELNIGDKVYKGDVLQSGQGASLGITFIDGTVFSLSSSARMVLNEMVYDPNGSSNSSLLSLVQGTITFVAGQTAKNGNMRVDTPVATMGIRGTAVLVEIGADNGPTKFSVLVEPGNKVGSFNLYDKTTGALLGSVSQAGQVTLVTPGGIGQQATAVELPKTILDLQNERSIIKQAFEMFFPNFNDANPQGTKGIGSSVNNLANILNGSIKVDPGTVIFKTDVNLPGGSGPVTVTATAVSTPPPIVITDATDIQPPEERGGSFNIADQVGPKDSRIIPYIAGSGKLDTAEGPSSMPAAFPLRDLVTLDAQTGQITYNPADFRFLADGEQAIYTFSFLSQSNEFIFTKTLTLTIDGLNDAPIFTVENFAVPVVEPGSTDSAATFSKQGTLTFNDADFSDVASGYTVQTLGVTATGKTTAVPNAATLLGFLHLDGVAKAVGSTQGVITETFSAPASAFDYLAAGETVNLAYQIRVTDADGASRTSTLTVTVTGTNDAPTITGATTPASTSGDLSEDGVLTASGVITFRDVDLSNTHTAVSALAGGTISTPLPGFNPATSMLGSLAVTVNENAADANNIGTVSWVYSLDNLIAQRLAEGQVVTQTFTVTITDSSGATVTQPVTVTITGANDVPTIVLSPPDIGDPVTIDTGAVTEEVDVDIDGDISATGIVVFKDVDLADTHTASVALKSSFVDADLPDFDEGVVGVATNVDSIGTFTLDTALIGSNTDLIDIGVVGWTFTVDNDHPVVQSLAEGQIITQVYTVTITDSSGAPVTKDITVTITGANDTPVISVATPDPVQEGDAGTPALVSVDVADFVTISDIDAIDVRVPYVTGTLMLDLDSVDGPAPGTGSLSDLFTVDAVNGTIGYDRAAFDYLSEGEEVTATFTFWASSGPDTIPQTITVTITGANDAPVITSEGGGLSATVSIAENTTAVTMVTATDVDHDTTIEYSIIPTGPDSPDAALFTINPATGALSFIAPPNYEAPVGGDNTYVIQVRASDGTTEDIQTITVNVTDVQEGFAAANDAVSLNEDTASAGLRTLLIANDSNPGALTLTITAVGNAQGGTIDPNGGNPIFTPDVNFSGQASFEYTLSNGVDAPSTATVTVDVEPVVDTATVNATSSAASANEDQTISLGAIVVSLGDVDSETFVLKLSGFPAGATFSRGALVTAGPDVGKWLITEPTDLSAVASGALTMTPPANYNGTFTLQVDAVVTDTAGLSTGSVSVSGAFSDTIAVTFDPVNDAPVALDIDKIGTEDQPITFFAPDLLRAQDADFDDLVTTISNVQHLTPDDQGLFFGTTPDPHFSGIASFDFTVSDGNGGTDTGTVRIDFRPVADAPIFTTDASASGDTNTPILLGFITAAVTDPDGSESLVLKLSGFPDGASFSVGAAGPGAGEWVISDPLEIASLATTPLSMTPPQDYDGAFTLHVDAVVTDQATLTTGLASDTATVTHDISVTVNSANTAPDAGADQIQVFADYAGVISNLTYNDNDPDHDVVTISGAAHGQTQATAISGGFAIEGLYGTLYLYSGQALSPFDTVVNPGDYAFVVGKDADGESIPGNPIFDLQPDETLSDSFTYTISDGNGGFDTATIDLTVQASPAHVDVHTPLGYDTTTLSSDLFDGIVSSINATGVVLHNGVRTIHVEAKNLVFNHLGSNDYELTGGLIKGFTVVETATGNVLFTADHYSIPAVAAHAALSEPGGSSAALDAIFQTYAYQTKGSVSADTLRGGDRDDEIDTRGGADHVETLDGDDRIQVYDDNGWTIDGGEGIDTIQVAGSVHTGSFPPGSTAANIEIIDLNTTHSASVVLDGEGVAGINDDGKVRILGNGADAVNFENSDGLPGYEWEQVGTGVHFDVPDDFAVGVLFDLYEFTDGSDTVATAYVQQGVIVNFAPFNPLISTDHAIVMPVPDVLDGSIHFSGLEVSDADGESGDFTISVTAEHGSLSNVLDDPGLTSDPDGADGADGDIAATGSLALVNAAAQAGVTYTPDVSAPSTDKLIITVSDPAGHTDTTNILFGQTTASGVTLTGTSDKDVFVGTSGADNFVFQPASAHDIIMNFTAGTDTIDIHQFAEPNSTNIATWLNDHANDFGGPNTLIDLGDGNTITLLNVQKAALSANDFIVHPS